jgi:hypothetical protein
MELSCSIEYLGMISTGPGLNCSVSALVFFFSMNNWSATDEACGLFPEKVWS